MNRIYRKNKEKKYCFVDTTCFLLFMTSDGIILSSLINEWERKAFYQKN
jgi:hypothetical protein